MFERAGTPHRSVSAAIVFFSKTAPPSREWRRKREHERQKDPASGATSR